MFDLEERIRHWRQAQAHALGGRAEVLDELESHLREEVQRLVAAGQTPGSAWETALAHLGDPRQLAAEFGKVSPPGALGWLPAFAPRRRGAAPPRAGDFPARRGL